MRSFPQARASSRSSRRFEPHTHTNLTHFLRPGGWKEFLNTAVWRALIHISSHRTHPGVIKQINWTLNSGTNRFGNTSVLHSAFLPALVCCSYVFIPLFALFRTFRFAAAFIDHSTCGGDCCDPRAGELDAAAKFNSEWLHMGTSPGGPHLSLDHGEEQKAGKQTMNEHCSFSMIKPANGSQINPK